MARAALLSIVSGLLLSCSFPPANLEWLGWVAVAPLLFAARGRTVIEAMGLGLFAGITCGLVIAGVQPAEYAGLAYSPFVLLSLVLGAVTAAARSLLEGRGWRSWPLLVACAGVTVEFVSTFSPLPIHLGLTQHLGVATLDEHLPWLGIMPLVGIWGTSFAVWLVNAEIAQSAGSSLRRAIGEAVVVAALAAMATGLTHAEEQRLRTVRVAAIQDFEGVMAGRDGRIAEPGDRVQMTREAAKQGASIVVWSEMGLGTDFHPEDENDPVRKLARELNVYLVVGFKEKGEPKPFNSVALIDRGGNVLAIHHKRNLFLGERWVYGPSDTVKSVRTGIGNVGLEICFDNCFTGLTRELAQRGAQLIVVPNYDPPTPRGVTNWLHTAFTPFRAAENRVAIVRADANGLSEIIAPSGRVIKRAPLYAPATLVADVPLAEKENPFAVVGEWLRLRVRGVASGRGGGFEQEPSTHRRIEQVS